MSAFTAAPALCAKPAASANRVSMRAAKPSRSVAAKAAFSVTLMTPDGKKEFKCNDDQYILDAAEVRRPDLRCFFKGGVVQHAQLGGTAHSLTTHTRCCVSTSAWCCCDQQQQRCSGSHVACRRTVLTCRTRAALARARPAPGRWRCVSEPEPLSRLQPICIFRPPSLCAAPQALFDALRTGYRLARWTSRTSPSWMTSR